MSRKPATPKQPTPRPVKVAKIPTPTDDFDGAWKFIIREQLPLFLAFFWNSLYHDIDWSRGFEFLDKELRRIARGRKGNQGQGIVDVLIKVWMLDGTTEFLLLHIEFQAQKDETLSKRMFIYNVRAYDLYEIEVLSLAVLADNQADWRPHAHGYGRRESTMHFTFHTQKLLDWKGREAELEAAENPFGLAVLAHLQTQATQGDAENRYQARLRLSRLLLGKGWSRGQIESLYEFLGWLLALPARLESRYEQEPGIREYEEVEGMKELETISPYHRRMLKREVKKEKQLSRDEGRTFEARNLIQRIGTKRFGPLNTPTEERLNSITALEELEKLADRLTEVESWTELLTL